MIKLIWDQLNNFSYLSALNEVRVQQEGTDYYEEQDLVDRFDSQLVAHLVRLVLLKVDHVPHQHVDE